MRDAKPRLFRRSVVHLVDPDIPPALALRDLTPPGAAALRCWPYGFGGYDPARKTFDRNFGPDANGIECVLPLTAPPSVSGESRWIDAALAAARVDGAPPNERARELLAATLAPGPTRPDGLPAYRPAGPQVGGAEAAAAVGTLRRRVPGVTADYDTAAGRMVYREPFDYQRRPVQLANGREATFTATTYRRHDRPAGQRRGLGRNTTRPIRDLLAAVVWDLMACSVDQVARQVLGSKPRRESGEEGSIAWRSQAYETRRRGRLLLAELGCWPWAHVPGGKLPRRWRADAALLEPVHAWAGASTSREAA